MEDNSKKTNGVGAYSDAPLFSKAVKGRYEFMLDQAVRFLDRLSNLVISAEAKLRTKAINGRNVVVRARGLDDASVDLKKLVNETKDWHVVIETMKQGKDVHSQHNGGCKSSKLEIVGGSAHEFGQYLIDKTLTNSDGKNYIEKVAGDGN